MDRLQQQINTLNQKVDQLNRIVERLSGQLMILASHSSVSSSSVISSDQPLQPLPNLNNYHSEKRSPNSAHRIISHDDIELVGQSDNTPQYPSKRYRATLEHRDVLIEDEVQSKLFDPVYESEVPSETQIRRLTAQLTAAYNRIAILEEQLLAQRAIS